MKLNDLDGEEKIKIKDQLESNASALGLDAWESCVGHDGLLEHQIGICAKCKSFSYCKTEFGPILAKCEEFEFRLSGKNRVTDCNLFSPRGMLTLNEMQNIATLIDPQNKVVPGFTGK